jgi:hypothetical protein
MSRILIFTASTRFGLESGYAQNSGHPALSPAEAQQCNRRRFRLHAGSFSDVMYEKNRVKQWLYNPGRLDISRTSGHRHVAASVWAIRV